MIIYLAAFTLSILLAAFAEGFRKRSFVGTVEPLSEDDRGAVVKRNFQAKAMQVSLLACSAAILVFIAGTREGVGTDYNPIYVPYFNNISHGNDWEWDLGFIYLVKLVALFSKDYHWFFFIASLATVGLAYRAVYLYSKNYVFSVFLLCFGGYFFFSLNGVRQALAIALFLNAVPRITGKRFLPYLSWILVASLFHLSAILLIVAYPLAKKIKKPRHFVLVLIGTMLLSFIIVEMVSILPERFSRYTSPAWANQRDNYDVSGLLVLSSILLTYAFLYRRKVLRELEGKELQVYIALLFLGLCCVLLAGSLPIVGRFTTYFSTIIILAVPELMSCIKRDKTKLFFTWGVCTCFFLSAIFLYGYLNLNHVLPYESFLFG